MGRIVSILLALVVALLLASCGSAAPVVQSAIPSRILEPWVTVKDLFGPGDLAREWRFSGQTGDEAQITVTSAVALDVALTDANGVAMGQGAPVTVTLPADGTYRVVVASREPASYRITLTFANQPAPSSTPSATPTATLTLPPTDTVTPTASPTPSATATPTLTPTPVYAALGDLRGTLRDGDLLTGQFISSFERHIYLFEGQAGQIARIALDGQDAVDAALTLYAPDGSLIAADDDSGGERDALLAGIRIVADGTYIVQAISSEGSGPYALGLSLTGDMPQPVQVTPTASPTLPVGIVTPVPAGSSALADHVPVLGRLDEAGDVARFTVALEAGDVLTAVVQSANGSRLLPRVQFITPAGEVMLQTGLITEAGGALIAALAVPEAGVYSLYVSGDNQTSGDFQIATGLGESHTDMLRGEARAGEAIEGALGQRGLRDVWMLPLRAGDTAHITVSPLIGGFAPSVVLSASDGAPLASASAVRGSPNPAIDATASADGWYRLEITGGPALTYGPYRLEWTRTPVGSETPALAAVPVLTAHDILVPGEYRDYPFQGVAGERMRLRVVADDGAFDPVAVLIAPDGSVLAQADDSLDGSLNPALDIILPASGTFLWRVNGYNGAGGAMEVRVERLVEAAGAGS
ncbi:MAG: hypothetical protein JNL34_10830 [Anaerolineae bacterium]|nr:hypothetical protein [Anaerolineae bacterium]